MWVQHGPPSSFSVLCLGMETTEAAMKHGKILKGKPFDWKTAEKANETLAEAADGDGRLDPDQVPWGAAMMADPGVCKCPICGEILWHEGEVLECPECGAQFFVKSRRMATTARKFLELHHKDEALDGESLHKCAVAVLAQGDPFAGENRLGWEAVELAALWLCLNGYGDEFIEVTR